MNIDIIGRLYEPSDDPSAEPALLPGWHVNVTPAVIESHPDLDWYRVEPSPMRRVWAGDDPLDPKITVPLRFEDEETALLVLEDAGLLQIAE